MSPEINFEISAKAAKEKKKKKKTGMKHPSSCFRCFLLMLCNWLVVPLTLLRQIEPSTTSARERGEFLFLDPLCTVRKKL